ncbi:MAG: dephospho-CoA kinase [Verrucomicrobiota bacterium]
MTTLAQNQPRLGLTGGIGSGKSTVGNLLKDAGFIIIETDLIARKVLEPSEEGYEKTIDAFGESILNKDKTIHRGLLGQLVFSDPIKRDQLNSLLHPLIRKIWQERYQELSGQNPKVPVVVIIPLLYETNLEAWFSSIACVGCSPCEQVRRLTSRGLSRKEIEQRIVSQLPTERKMEQADLVLWNNGSLALLKAQVKMLCQQWSE